MKRIFGIMLAAALAAAVSAGQITRNFQTPGLVPVPSSGTGGQAGGSSNPANVTTVVTNGTDSFVVGQVKVTVYLTHVRAADLTISLSHCGTTVSLFSGSSNQLASVNGPYTFSDSVPTSFTTAVNQAAGLVPPFTYKPSQPLTPFISQSASGPWTVTITDLVTGVSGTAGNVTVEVTSGANFGGSVIPGLAIPDCQNGIPGQPVTRVVNVATPGTVGTLRATIGLIHTYTSDLTVVLSHAGVSATIMSYNAPLSGANLLGNYTFQDDAASSWAETVAGLGSSFTVNNGDYRPLSPFAAFRGLDQAGPWFLTICDLGTGDTGSLTHMLLQIAPTAWDLQITQPSGPAFVTLANTGGFSSNSYANLVSFAPGAYPNGWLYGIDIGMDDLAYQVNFGAPFFGTLSACGAASTTVAGPIPSNLPCWITSLELDPSGSVVSVKPGFAYTTP